MHRFLIATLLLLLVGGGMVLVYQTLTEDEPEDFSANLISVDDIDLPSVGFAEVDTHYDWQFPADYEPHPDYQREQWRLTANDSCAVMLDVIFERISLVPDAFIQDTPSNWRTNTSVVATAVIKVDNNQLLNAQRAERMVLGLAGVSTELIFVDNWTLNFAENTLRLNDAGATLSVTFTLEDGMPQTATDEWLSYKRTGKLSTESTFEGLDNFDCDFTLTHQFGTPS